MSQTANRSYVQESALRSFSHRPLLSPEENRKFFTNFEDEVKKIKLAIEVGDNALVIGERGSGKSSLLYHVNNQLSEKKKFLPIQISALVFDDFTQYSFFSNILNELISISENYKPLREKFLVAFRGMPENQESISKHTMNSTKGQDEQESKEPYRLIKRISTLITSLRENKIEVFILLDDTDKINSDNIWGTFRGIRDTLWKLRLSIIITALPNQINEITRPPLDHFFSYKIKINPFDSKITKEMVNKRLRASGTDIKISDMVFDEVNRRTNGNPRSIIEVFRKIFESNESLTMITEKNLDEVGIIYAEKMPDTERTILNYLLKNPNTSASSEDFLRYMKVSRSRLAQILNELKKEGLVGWRKEGTKTVYYITKTPQKESDKKEFVEQGDKKWLIENVYTPAYDKLMNTYTNKTSLFYGIPPDPWSELPPSSKLKTESDMKNLFEDYSVEVEKWRKLFIESENDFMQQKSQLAEILKEPFQKAGVLLENGNIQLLKNQNMSTESWLDTFHHVLFDPSINDAETLYLRLREFSEIISTRDFMSLEHFNDTTDLFRYLSAILPKLRSAFVTNISYESLSKQRAVLKSLMEKLVTTLGNKIKSAE